MYILSFLILVVVAILHLLLHFVVRKDNVLVVVGSVVFAAISMAASYFFVRSQWDHPGQVYITVLLGTYITAELFYVGFTTSMMEIDTSKSVEAKFQNLAERRKGDLKFAFWYALSGDGVLPTALGCMFVSFKFMQMK